jgi:enoyl-CoA hydratase/carnithine racemase
MPDPSQFNTDRAHPGRWTITFSNPPINMFVPSTIVELGVLMTDLEADPSVKIVVFQSANPDFFIAHLDVAKAAERPEVLGLWRDFPHCQWLTTDYRTATSCAIPRCVSNWVLPEARTSTRFRRVCVISSPGPVENQSEPIICARE